ncbi:aminotransferase class I/II-fold pyridoxal phosphate-dependent enzyme [Silvanigrella aquatica]|uniref:Aminotransferase class I/classII large domain-containing protein n=1 Tax=Silvanigrella aquatica TaxID=1915309 RepID=A0A1L4D380_9BACT|nr:pyridoxal phosphate-dependent aminotransferase family protein [Silvanigrella aquatica]APJ04665.1 hypothetical protein AXG55_12425 [Silvanigrella aquatica]
MSFEYLNEVWKYSNELTHKASNYRTIFPYYEKTHKDYNINFDFSSNDYLGLRNDQRIIDAGYQSALKYGAGSGASRMIMQTDFSLEEVEKLFSQFIDYKYSLFFSSGYVANLSLFDTLAPFSWEESSFEQHIFIDHMSHSSLFYGLRNSKIKYDYYKHNDYKHLEFKLKSSKLSQSSAKIIVTESLFSMDGDYSNPYKLFEICKKFGAALIIDETHTLGAYGEKGSWILQYPFLKPYILASVFGCGKAVGVSGGFITTDHFEFKERIFQKSRFILQSTAVSPFITGAVKKSLEIIFSNEGILKRNLLRKNIQYLNSKLKVHYNEKSEFKLIENYLSSSASNIIPIIYHDSAKIIEKEKFFLKNGILLKCIRPPSVPRGTSRFRVILRSNHSKQDLDILLNYLFEL